MTQPNYSRSRRQLRRARIQSALTMPRQGVNPRAHRDLLLELLALERVETDRQFGALAEDQVETIVSIALADVPDDPEDRVFVLLECLSLLMRDGQFARGKVLAARLESGARAMLPDRPYLRLSVSALGQVLGGRLVPAKSDLERSLGPEAPAPTSKLTVATRRDLAVAGALKAAVASDDIRYATRARDLLIRLGDDGLGIAVLEATIAWYEARESANPLAVLREADSTFDSKSLGTYIDRRGINVLFPAQITAIRAGLTTDKDLTVSLPTSSGKTLLAEFKIAATLERDPDATVVYVAPYRLLARQVTRGFQRYLGPRLGHSIHDLGSGYDMDTPDTFGNVLVCTPERLDALIRKASTDEKSADVLARCRLLVFDEMHLIGRSGRGPRFELLLTRMRLRFPTMQILALSAASQGVDDVAAWLTHGEVVRSGRRPTGTIEVAWETDGTFVQRVDRHAPTPVAELERSTRPIGDAVLLISRLSSEYRPVLAVCTQRAYAETIATSLVETDPVGNRLWLEDLTAEAAEQLEDTVEVVASMMGAHHPLTNCLRNGVGFHHAGVPAMVLGLIEDLAAQRILRAVAATTTVAEGADLPFRAVVIPHLNFQGGTGKLERDLYLNIIGRAGRANVAIEGVVFILGSNAATLGSHIRGTLWTTAQTGRVLGQLGTITTAPRSAEETTWYGEYESQVMGWLGDGESYYPDQAERLAAATFTFQTGTSQQQRHVRELTRHVLESLEEDGFAIAASPFRLTDKGMRARLTGMSTGSVTRIEAAIEAGADGWLPSLVGAVDLTAEQCAQVARIVFESTETMAHSLWLRRERKTEVARSAYLAGYARRAVVEHSTSEVFWAEINALSMWIDGASFDEIADTMPTFGHQGLFGSSNRASRVSDVAEYVSRVGYPGSWTWSAAQTLARELHSLSLPPWIAGAVEYGASDETAVTLMRSGRLSRPGALALARELGPSWDLAAEVLQENDTHDAGLSEVDEDRLEQLRFLIRDRTSQAPG